MRARPSRVAAAVVLVGAASVAILPLAWALVSSLRTDPPGSAYAAALTTAPLLRYGLNSVLVAVLTAVGQTATGALAAYAFARLHFRGRDLLFLVFLGTLLLPSQATLLPTFLLLRTLGLVDSYSALIVPNLVHPFAIFLIRQSLLELPGELEDAARVDGCSRLGTMWRIALPHATPALLASALFSFLWSWNSFTWPLIAVQTQHLYTLPVGLAMLSNEMENTQPVVLAGAMLATLPVALLFLALQGPFMRTTDPGGTQA